MTQADKVKQLQSKTLGMMFASYMSIYFVRKPFSVVKVRDSTPYTLHPTPYTLHPTPYTLNPKP
jgi:sugar phosphate permease